MTPVLRAVYDELIARAAAPPLDSRSQPLRAGFTHRCGQFPSDHPSADARDAASWEDVLVRGGLAAEIANDLEDPAESEVALSIARAQRGVFVLELYDDTPLWNDLWSGASFILAQDDAMVRELVRQLNHESSHGIQQQPCQARVIATSEGCAVLPGAIFHPAEARPHIERTLDAARRRHMSTDHTLDALLRMEHAFRTLSRVKVGYAYRPEGLG